MSFLNKVVIVTGASSGIGAAIAVAFSSHGANVTMVGLQENKLKAVSARCSRPLPLLADVTKEEDVQRIINETIKKYGKLDILINNAGIAGGCGILDDNLMETYDAIMNVNLRAAVHLTNVAAPHLVKTKGNIVNISTVGALIPPAYPGAMSYNVSKAGLNHFTICAAAELAPYGIRVNTVSPGPVKTDLLENSNMSINWDHFKELVSFKRVSEPEELADLVLFLANDKAKAITGSNYVSDNGMYVKRG